jgi:Secretion system C-terminal sorting domain
MLKQNGGSNRLNDRMMIKRKCKEFIMNRMKTFLRFNLFLFFLTGNSLAHVGLDYPNGGETFEISSTVSIEWHIEIDHGNCNWDLYFSSNGGVNWESIATDLPKTQLTYDWTVPNSTTSSGEIKVVQDNQNGIDYDATSGNFTISSPTVVKNDQNSVNKYELSPAYPNPFNPSTKIRYSLPHSSNVKLIVFNLIGEKIATLVDEVKSPGTYEVNFDASNLPTGTYLYQLQTNDFITTKKMILLK